MLNNKSLKLVFLLCNADKLDLGFRKAGFKSIMQKNLAQHFKIPYKLNFPMHFSTKELFTKLIKIKLLLT